MSEHEPKPVAFRWAWKTTGSEFEQRFADPDLYEWTYRDRPPSSEAAPKMDIEPLYPASDITALQEENRKQTFRADINHRIMLRHAESSSGKSVKIQNLKAYIDKMTAEAWDAIGRERKRAEAAEKRALDNEARANAAEQRLKEAVKVLEPFAAFDSVYDRNEDANPVMVALADGRSIRANVGDIRAARALKETTK